MINTSGIVLVILSLPLSYFALSRHFRLRRTPIVTQIIHVSFFLELLSLKDAVDLTTISWTRPDSVWA